MRSSHWRVVKKITDCQILKFEKEAVGFLATLCTHLMEKNPVKSFTRYLCCVSPNFIRECSETCEKLFDKVLSKLVSYRVVTPDTANHSKSQYRKFVNRVVKENNPEFLDNSRTHQPLDKFMMKFVGASRDFLTYANSSRFYWYYCMLRLKLSTDSVSTKICLWKINTQQL